MKKLLLTLMLCFTFTTQSFSFGMPSIPATQNNSSVLSSTLLSQLLEDNLAQNLNMLEMSKNLKVSSQSINSIDGINEDYILAKSGLETCDGWVTYIFIHQSEDIEEWEYKKNLIEDFLKRVEKLLGK